MKKYIAIAALAILALTGCAGSSLQNHGDYYTTRTLEIHKQLKDGRTVDCVMYIQGGISCDWESLAFPKE